jgi:hypothetical protein
MLGLALIVEALRVIQTTPVSATGRAYIVLFPHPHTNLHLLSSYSSFAFLHVRDVDKRVLAFGPHVGALFGDELQISVRRRAFSV